MLSQYGSNNRGYEQIMGTHGLGVMNENEEIFADFCVDNDMVIGGSLFPHKDVHQATWVSHEQMTENQKEHICMNQKFRRSLLDIICQK